MSSKQNDVSRGGGSTVICTRNVTKTYQIYDLPRDRLKQFVIPHLRRMLGISQRRYFREFSALKDVSFEIMKGETVGIIGRNGAGKSTLLQILCGTLSPTSGDVHVDGRVAALLELGSGFNMEFTGRENVYMNAGILGLTKKEIDERFEDIVAFADIGPFLDQPVKTYSSGMYVRLAFAVVVHVDADILIVDEALSVGDMYFQAKCMAQMKRLMATGVTVLFVSHDIGAVKALCDRAIYLDRGEVVLAGKTDIVTEAYYGKGVESLQLPREGDASISSRESLQVCKFNEGELEAQAAFSARAQFQRIQNGMAELLNVQVLDGSEKFLELVEFGQSVILRVSLKANIDLPSIGLGYHIRDKNGVDVVYSDTGLEEFYLTNLKAGEIAILDWSFKAQLREGDYTIAIMLSIPQDLSSGKVEICDFAPLAANFKVARGNSLPIYGYVYWPNKLSVNRFSI